MLSRPSAPELLALMPLAGRAATAAPLLAQLLLLALALLGGSCCAAVLREQPPPSAHAVRAPLQEYSVRQLPEAVDFAPAEATARKEAPEPKQRLAVVATASKGEAEEHQQAAGG